MPAGDLSPDQSRYVDLVSSETGLARIVVVAWVGAESHWGTNKAGHNYLNIGPGRTYPTTEQAAASVAGLINDNSLYYGVKDSIPAGPAAQVQAIGESPWGTSAALLSSVYDELSGSTPATNVSIIGDLGKALTLGPSLIDPNIGTDLGKGLTLGPSLIDPNIGSGLGSGLVGGVLGDIAGPLLKIGLTMVFTVAALALLSMSLHKLVGVSPVDVFQKATSIVGMASQAAAL